MPDASRLSSPNVSTYRSMTWRLDNKHGDLSALWPSKRGMHVSALLPWRRTRCCWPAAKYSATRWRDDVARNDLISLAHKA